MAKPKRARSPVQTTSYAEMLYRRYYPKGQGPSVDFEKKLLADAVTAGAGKLQAIAADKRWIIPINYTIVVGPEQVDKPRYHWVRLGMLVLGEQSTIPKSMRRGPTGRLRPKVI